MNPPPFPSAPASGERKLHAQEVRRATPSVVLLLLGFAHGLSGAAEGWLSTLPPSVVWIGVCLIAVAAGALTLVWVRRADEVEVAEQLWSGFFALQVFAIGAPAGNCWRRPARPRRSTATWSRSALSR